MQQRDDFQPKTLHLGPAQPIGHPTKQQTQNEHQYNINNPSNGREDDVAQLDPNNDKNNDRQPDNHAKPPPKRDRDQGDGKDVQQKIVVTKHPYEHGQQQHHDIQSANHPQNSARVL